jgi:WD40 repeat protein
MERADRDLVSRNGRRDGEQARPWRGRWRRLLGGPAAIVVLSLIAARAAHGQAKAMPDGLVDPILVLNGQGHTGDLRALAFSQDGKYLLSGGLDKVVHVWGFQDGDLRLDQTIRPPIWRVSGLVFALAVSPSPATGSRLVAVAGHSLLDSAGQILIYRLPAPDRPGPIELAFELPDRVKTPGNDRRGHQGHVFGLSFSPDGRYLASSGEDHTIRIWDLNDEKHPPVRVLPGDPTGAKGHVGTVMKVVFVGKNQLISVGGKSDGSLRIWDWTLAEPLVRSVKPSEEEQKAQDGAWCTISALAAIPGGPFIAIGHENGRLECFDADLGNRRLLNPDELKQMLAVEALALGPDGRTLAAITFKNKPTRDELPRTECRVTLRTLPGGEDVKEVRATGDVARALAFSPDGQFLAMGGGAAQEVAVKPVADLAARGFEVTGPGTVLWSVAFVDVANKPTVAFTRNRLEGPAPPVWEAFDFPAHRFVPVDRAARLDPQIKEYTGWTVTSLRHDRLAVAPPQGDPITIQLDGQAGRWTSYTFIPRHGEAKHDQLTLAVGTASGSVLVFSLPDGRRTRVLQGHSGAVYGMAPSSDGRWLATGSADQTVRLWSLADCDKRPALGATLERDPQGKWIVKEVPIRSPAQEMGLKVNDRVEAFYEISSQNPLRRLAGERLDAEIDALEPGTTMIRADVSRGGAAPVPLQTARRDQSALNLLPGSHGEWIVWMPENFYDTSIAGDVRLLGWHLNKLVARNEGGFEPLLSDFVPMSRYEKLLHRRDVIDRLIQTGDPVAALQLAQVIPRPQPPPIIQIFDAQGAPVGPAVQVQQPTLSLRIDARGSSAERRVASILVRNGLVSRPQIDFAPPRLQIQAQPETVSLWPGVNPISVEAVDDLGVLGRRDVLVEYQHTPPKTQAGSRLVIRSIGIEKFAAGDLGRIRFADRDADFLADFLQARGEHVHFAKDRIDRKVLNTQAPHPDVNRDAIANVFKQLKKEADSGDLGAGDTVFLVVESHVLDFGQGPLLLGPDARLPAIEQAAVNTNLITEDLKYVAGKGCLVLLFLDGIHGELPLKAQRNLTDWVRTLWKNGVMVLVASKLEESERGNNLSVFAEAISGSVTVRGAGRRLLSPTLDEFQGVVIRGVAERTSRRQHADFYPPEHIQPRLIRIFEPQPRPSENLAAAQPQPGGLQH